MSLAHRFHDAMPHENALYFVALLQNSWLIADPSVPMDSGRSPSPPSRRERLFSLLKLALAAAGASAVILAVATTRADVDLWGHVRFGMDILDAGRIKQVDPYSFTSRVPWINHEWLTEVIFAIAWRIAGSAGLIGVKLACAIGVLSFVALTLRARGITGHTLAMLLGVTLAGTLPRITHVRPQLFSTLLFAALIAILSRAERGRRAGLIWTVPLLALWANLHGGWIVGLATVGVWTLGDAWEKRASGWRALAVVGYPAAAAAATLLNPYGVGLWTFLLETVRFGREAITEWGPAWSDPLLLLLWGVFSGLTISAVKHGPRPRNPAGIIIPAMWGLAALRVGRLDAFFALSVIGFLGPNLVWLVDSRQRRRGVPAPLALRAAAIGIAAILLVAFPAARRTFTCLDVYAPWWPEPEAIAFAHQEKLSGRVVTFFRWGEYAIWHLPPSLKVSMDGRRETVYSDATIDGHLLLYGGQQEGLAYLDSLESDYVWLPRLLPVSGALQSRGWVPIFQGPRSLLLARSDLAPGLSARAVVHESASRCFPGP